MSEREADGWAAHTREQRRAWLRLTYAQRLQWLEQAKEFAQLALRAAAARREALAIALEDKPTNPARDE